MVDNVAITAGSGTTVATDDVGGAHYQRVKITDGTADGTTHLKIVAEDAAHSTGDTGIVLMAVRKDTAAALAGTDGDYIPLIVDSTGRLHISNADLATLAGAVSGSEVQVDIVSIAAGDNNIGNVDIASALPAGTNAIGKLAANSGVDIGDVDILSIAAGDNNIGNVDIASALPAGTNAIGKLAANSGVDIGDVDILSIAAGENVIGLVGASDIVKEVTLSLDTGGAYASGDVLAATQEITNAARVNTGVTILNSVTILDKDDQAQALDLVFLRTNVSIGTENAAVSVSDANADEILGVVEVAAADYVDLVNSQIVHKSNLGMVMDADSGATSLWVAAISRGTGTYTASGITLKLGFLRS